MKRTPLAPLLAAALLALPSAPANATPQQEDALFDTMNDVGISLYTRAVDHAAQVCAQVWSGDHPDVVVSRVLEGNSDWSLYQARVFVAASIGIYCPPTAVPSHAQDALRKI